MTPWMEDQFTLYDKKTSVHQGGFKPAISVLPAQDRVYPRYVVTEISFNAD